MQAAYGNGKGVQLITFTTTASGNFSVYLEDSSGNKIGGCPYKFFVLESHLVVENKTVVYGSGLNASTVGESSIIFVQLKDIEDDYVDGYSETVFALISINDEHEMTVIATEIFNTTGLYMVNFTLTRSGTHDVLLLYCNTPLNSGNPFKKVVDAGRVNLSLTVLVPTDGSVPHPYAAIPHSITVLLKDNYGNPVPGQKNLLSVEFYYHVYHPPTYTPFQESITGNYTFVYRAYQIEPLLLYVLYNKNKILPGFPLDLRIHSYGFFPHPINDVVWTWEDTALIVDVLGNDYFGLKPGRVTMISKQPANGFAYIKDQKVIYVPQKGFTGGDTFVYNVEDNPENSDNNLIHTDIALGTVFTVKHPPRILSKPSPLEVCAESSLPIKSGDKTFTVFYSDAPLPIAYAQIAADFGHLETIATGGLSWTHSKTYSNSWPVEAAKAISKSVVLEIVGEMDDINLGLNALVYTGAQDFFGYDTVSVSVKDIAGLGEEASIRIKVKRVNNPPIITSYPYILVDSQNGSFIAGINDLGREIYNDSLIEIMDYDIEAENETCQLEILIQVENGNVSVMLSENITESTELKQEGSYHWSPLSAAVLENDLFTAQAQGIKFRASLLECNKALKTLSYNGTTDGVPLLIQVNDLGHWGMDSVCSTESYPRSTEKQMTLVFSVKQLLQMLQSSQNKAMTTAKLLLALGVLTILIFITFIICCFILVAWKRRKSKEKVKEYLLEESSMDASRFYNPMWIPAAPSTPKLEFLNSSSPHHYNLQKTAFKEGLSAAHEKMESLAFHIKKHWASIKSFRNLSFKMNLGKEHAKD
ncbi:hypothetical protein KP509_39G032500 [Ceratopteris richardii]|nr:hypothetical protein KP509_39G032500 [Ceratopteris richardii]